VLFYKHLFQQSKEAYLGQKEQKRKDRANRPYAQEGGADGSATQE